MRTRLAALSWTASTDNVRVTGYDAYRAPGTLLGPSGQVTFTGGGGCTAAATVQSRRSSGYVVASYNRALGPDASTAFGLQARRPNGRTTVPSGHSCAN